MKTIQITVDEELLSRLDADTETKRDGRSAVLRRAVSEYLQKRRRSAITEGYRRGYGEQAGLGADFEGWENQGTWPTE